MRVYKWMHAATAAALLGALAGCEAEDFNTDPEVMENQPADTYSPRPTAPGSTSSDRTNPADLPEPPGSSEELQQNSQNNPLGAPNQDDTLDPSASLNAPQALEEDQPESSTSSASQASGEQGAPPPAEQSPLEKVDELDEGPAALESDEGR